MPLHKILPSRTTKRNKSHMRHIRYCQRESKSRWRMTSTNQTSQKCSPFKAHFLCISVSGSCLLQHINGRKQNRKQIEIYKMFGIWKAVKVDIAQLRSEYISLLFTFDYSIAWDKAEGTKAVVSILQRDHWKGQVSIPIADKLNAWRLSYFDTPCFLSCWMISACHFTPKKLFWVEMPGCAQVTPQITDMRTARLCLGFVDFWRLFGKSIKI